MQQVMRKLKGIHAKVSDLQFDEEDNQSNRAKELILVNLENAIAREAKNESAGAPFEIARELIQIIAELHDESSTEKVAIDMKKDVQLALQNARNLSAK